MRFLVVHASLCRNDILQITNHLSDFNLIIINRIRVYKLLRVFCHFERSEKSHYLIKL